MNVMITLNCVLSLAILGFLVWRLGVMAQPPPPPPEPVQTPEPPVSHEPLTLLLFNKKGDQVAERVIHAGEPPPEVKHGGITYEKTGKHVRGISYTRKL